MKGSNMTKTKTSATKLTKFRAHFRKSSDNGRHTMDVEAKDIGGVHDVVRKAHQTDDVRVLIDKVKVLGE